MLGLINARAGSKGIPHKNIKPLLGKPLIAWTIEAALQSRALSHLVVSTEDAEIAAIAAQWGAQVPFQRPMHLATDEALQIDVVLHAVAQMEQREAQPYDVVVLLQPTAPLRTSSDIDQALQLLIESGADSVVSFSPVIQAHPYYLYTLEAGKPQPFVASTDPLLQRQDFPTVYVRNGAIYATRRDLLVQQRTYYGADCRAYVMPPERSINIDTPFDWQLVECMMGMMGRSGA
jgi:N-acylneuraminate cytidylyltransferase